MAQVGPGPIQGAINHVREPQGHNKNPKSSHKCQRGEMVRAGPEPIHTGERGGAGRNRNRNNSEQPKRTEDKRGMGGGGGKLENIKSLRSTWNSGQGGQMVPPVIGTRGTIYGFG